MILGLYRQFDERKEKESTNKLKSFLKSNNKKLFMINEPTVQESDTTKTPYIPQLVNKK
jgi:hypothetical protein